MLTPGGWGRDRERDDPHAAVRALHPPVVAAVPPSEGPSTSRAWKAAAAAGVLGAGAGGGLAGAGMGPPWLVGAAQLTGFGVALGLAAAAMLHPASPWLVEPAVDRRAPSHARQLAVLGIALLVLPVLATSLMLREADQGTWAPLTAVGMVVLAGLVMLRLERLVRSLRPTTALRHAEAHHDLSTGLPNTRGLFTDLAERADFRAGGPVGVLVISLAGVGEAGSVHGLDVSAGLLEQLAERLAAVLPDDASLGVLPGGDLAVTMTITNEGQLDQLGWRVRELASHAVVVGDVPLSCGASVGIAVHEPDETPQAVVRRADLASRWAERAGADGVQRYNAGMDAVVAHEVAVRTDIRHAIEHDELEVWCQPQLDIASGRVAGVECLARWRHPTRGPVPPAEFVAAARDIGAAAELDARMVHRVAQQAATWRAADLGIPRVAVNVEPTSLADPGFLAAVTTALRSAELPPGALEIELTEAVTADDQAHARDVLRQLRALGVSLAVDDFGTGYSSLAALHHLPMDVIKLDRELVSVLVDDPVLVSATITLVRRLGLRLVAEGVETPAELAMLEQAGCPVAQGYLLAEPMPAADLVAWHDRRMTRSQTPA